MAFAFVSPFIPALSLSNTLLSGAKLEFFAAGTTTPKAIYSDDDLTTPHTNPVVADANGRFPAIYLTPNTDYRVQLRTADDVTVGDLDSFSVPSPPSFASLTGTPADSDALTEALDLKQDITSPATFVGQVPATLGFRATLTASSPGVITSGFYGYYNATNGACINGAGSSYDLTLYNKDEEVVARVPTGTQDLQCQGAVTTTAGGIGYATGAGGTVTQATSKSTGVTLSKATGQITLNSASLAANTSVSFTLTNTAIAATDLVVLNHVSGGTAGAYTLNAQAASGAATITVRNVTAGALAEAIVIGFAVIKGATA